MVEFLCNEEEEIEQAYDENFVGNDNYMKGAPKEIMQYVEFTWKLLLEVEEQECINK
jgi:hypothetical protein